MDKAERTTEGSAPQGPVILTTGEVAEVLGIKGYQLAYLLETKRIPPPRKTLLGRRLFYTQADLEEIRGRGDLNLWSQRKSDTACQDP